MSGEIAGADADVGDDEDELSWSDFDDDDPSDRMGKLDRKLVGDDFVIEFEPRSEDHQGFEVLRFERAHGLLRFRPLSLRSGTYEKQFDRIIELQVENANWNPSNHSAEHGQYGLLYETGLPKGFSSIYAFGLGIARDYRGLLDEIDSRSSCPTVRFVRGGDEGADSTGSVFRVALSRFEEYRLAVERSRNRGRVAVNRVIQTDTHNAVANLFDLVPVTPKYTRHPVIRALTEEVQTGHVVSALDRSLLADEITSAAPKIGRESPTRLVQLREDIELASLDTLIERFEADLDGGYSRDEGHWQKFFNANRFALQLLFSSPIVVKLEHAVVQAGDIAGRGSRITDFLCANTITRTAVVVEIKTPAAPLVSVKAYRGHETDSAVFAPHSDLVGPVAQLQSQLASVPRSLSARLRASDQIDPWNDVRGGLISGNISALNTEQRESFLRYRAGLTNITVLGYDEVLGRLKSLRDMLKDPPVEERASVEEPSQAAPAVVEEDHLSPGDESEGGI